MHRVAFTLPAWKALPAGGVYELDMVYYLPISGPANYSVKINNIEYAFTFEQPDLPVADLSTGGGDNGGIPDAGCDATGLVTYPDLPQTDVAGNPSHANTGDKIVHNNVIYQANWWTSATPGNDGSWTKVCNL